MTPADTASAESSASRSRRLCDLGRQAASCPRFRWMPGMLAWWRLDDGDDFLAIRLHGWPWEYERAIARDPDEPVFPGYLDASCEAGGFGFRRDARNWPDLSDAATVGCLLALVREAWSRDPDPAPPYTVPLFPVVGGVVPMGWRCRAQGQDFDGEDEIEALVLAMLAAPERKACPAPTPA